MKKIILPVFIIFIISIFIVSFFNLFPRYIHHRNKKLAMTMVEKIESYRLKYNKLPINETEIGYPATMEGPIHYNKYDDVNYIVSYPIGFGESISFSSKTKKWSDK